MKRGCN